MITFLVLILVTWLISKKNEKVRFWIEKIIRQPFNYYFLIGLLIIGFIFRLDYSDRFGCIQFSEPIFEFKNILFSTISIILVLLSFFSKKRTIKLTFISFELLFWLVKLFLFKGGYVVNILGTADPLISLYDTATLALRFFIVNSLLKTNINKIYVLISTIIIMSIKIYIFPLPYSFYIEVRESQMKREKTRDLLMNSEWIENKDTMEKVRIIFYPENVVLYNLQNNDSLSFNLIYWLEESVFLESWGNSKHKICFFEFQEEGKDSLSVNIRYNDEDYKTKMIRKNACR